MPINYLTGTETERFSEIMNRWVNFSPTTYNSSVKFPLYTAPIGQTFASELIMQTGSVPMISGTIVVKKDIHIFESEQEADRFINEAGEDSISSVSERYGINPDLTTRKIKEIHLINLSDIEILMDLINNSGIDGKFKIEVFASGSDGKLKEMQKEPEYNLNGEIISDTFLKYFEIEES